MNKTLAVETLYDVFTFGNAKGIHPKRYFRRLLSSKDFKAMVEGRPFDLDELKSLSDLNVRKKETFGGNELRYLAFLTIEFIDGTDVRIEDLDQYLDAEDIIDNHLRYHSLDTDFVIFSLLIKRNSTYFLRKAKKDYFLSRQDAGNALYRLFPMKRFSSFRKTFDPRLGQAIFLGEETVVLAIENASILESDYFHQRYQLGNSVFCFLDSKSKPTSLPNGTLYLLFVDETGIDFQQPNGELQRFRFSN